MTAAALRVPRSTSIWRRIASRPATRVLALCVVFGGLIAVGAYRVWRPEIAPPMRLSGEPVALALSNPVDPFSRSLIGQLLYWPSAGDDCRRVLFDNRSGLILEAGTVSCGDIQVRPEPSSEVDRLTALRKTFQK